VDARRKRAREARKPDEARTALQILDLWARRFPQSARGKEEMAYRRGDCCRLAGDDGGFRDAMHKVIELDKNGDWGKLAAVRLAGPAGLASCMDELVRLSAGEREPAAVFLDLADGVLPALKSDALVKCLYYKARCLAADRKEQARELYRRVLKEFPTSPWAAESAFWLAEAHFDDKEYDKARAGYLELAAKYPHSPRAAQARRWADWLGEREAMAPELDRAVRGLCRRLTEARGGFAFDLRADDSEQGTRLRARLAYDAGANQAYLSLRCGDFSVLVANNKDAFWYRPPGREEMVKAPPLELPRAGLVANGDPVNNRINCGFGVGAQAPGDPGSPFQLSPGLAPALVSSLQTLGHLHVEKRPAGEGKARTVVRLQTVNSSWDATEPFDVELVLDADGRPVEIRGSWSKGGGRTLTATVSDLVLGGALPPAAFAVTVPEGVTVRPVESFNPMELWADAFRLMGVLGQQVKNELKK
jgi:tetratricopeptide (TPR) repeat protein